MIRSRLKNKANKTKSRDDIINYKKQRNEVVKLNKKSKFEYFWVNCKLYFSNRNSKADINIRLSENSELIMKNQDIANTFKDYFQSFVENLNLFQWNEHNGEIHLKILRLSLKTSRTIPVVRLSKNISKTTYLSLLGM